MNNDEQQVTSGKEMRPRISKRGFTLLETVIALAVIFAGVVGPFSLAIRAIYSSGHSRNLLAALQLSQEGIELVRNIRENNVLASRNWDEGIAGTPNPAGFQIDVAKGTLDPVTSEPQQLYYYPSQGLYAQSSPETEAKLCPGGTACEQTSGPNYPPFQRVIYISKSSNTNPFNTPDDNVGGHVPEEVGGLPTQIKVTSVVTWQERGLAQNQVTLEEIMFDWR